MQDTDGRRMPRGIIPVEVLSPGKSKGEYLKALEDLNVSLDIQRAIRGRIRFDEDDQPLSMNRVADILGTDQGSAVKKIQGYAVDLAKNLGEHDFEIPKGGLLALCNGTADNSNNSGKKESKKITAGGSSEFIPKNIRINLNQETIDKFLDISRELGTPTEFAIMAHFLGALDNTIQVQIPDGQIVEKTTNKIMMKAIGNLHGMLFGAKK